MKKWADLKCDGKRRIVALRGPNGSSMRKKKLGPVEKMVHKILMMNPTGGEVGGVKAAAAKAEIFLTHVFPSAAPQTATATPTSASTAFSGRRSCSTTLRRTPT